MNGGEDDIYCDFNEEEKTATIISFDLSEMENGRMAIPDSVSHGGENYAVTAIAAEAFKDWTELVHLEIPAAVTSIGERAFAGCTSLVDVSVLPATTQRVAKAARSRSRIAAAEAPTAGIGSQAFMGCTSLASVEIPVGMTVIGNEAFLGCASLSTIEMPSDIASIGSGAFSGCSSLAAIKIPAAVTVIEASTFNGCTSLASVEIPASVTAIGNEAFADCMSLTFMEIPASVTTLGSRAFAGCENLERICSLAETPPACADATVFEGVNVEACVVEVPAGTKKYYLQAEGWNAFARILDFVQVDGLCYELDKEAGTACVVHGDGTPAGEVVIPATIIYDGKAYDVTAIGEEAFADCSGLTAVEIPASVTTLGSRAFAGCEKLERISCLAETPPACADATVFEGVNVEACVVEVPAGTKKYYLQAEGWNAFARILDFVQVDGLCYELDKEAGTACVVRGDGTPAGEVVIPATVAYDGKTYDVTAIGEEAFADCSGLTAVEIPASVTTLGSRAFAGCGNLEHISCLAETPPACADATVFEGVNVETCVVEVPESAEEAYAEAEVWQDFFETEEPPTGIHTTHGDGAATIVGYYTPDGHKLPRPQRGVNVVRYADGTTRKVLVK